MDSYLTQIVVLIALLCSAGALLRTIYDRRFYEKRLEELHRRTIDAQRRLRQIGLLASEVAHEIKNPITAILCSAETLDLLIGKDIDKTHRDSLKYIKEYGDEVLHLVSDFLDVSKLETGKLEAHPKPVPLKRSVESILGLLKSAAFTRGVTLSNCVEDEAMHVNVDPKHLKQILFNLTHNAIKFTEDGGEVQVSARVDFPHEHILIEVKDNGRGMSEEEAERIFLAYETGKGGATGLGLALCKSLVELSMGEIAVRSELGVGSVFSFSLPRVESTERMPSRKKKVLSAETYFKGRAVIVFDEQQGSRDSIASLFEAWGAEVERASLAVDVFESVAREDFELVVLNDPADGLYAYEVYRMLREEVPAKQFQAVLLTSRQAHKLIEQSGDKSIICIPKPANGSVILSTLRDRFTDSATAH